MYEGRDEEDYGKFKDEIERAFVQNRISRSDKVSKLRECLRGHAKRLIPESITNDIDKAWEALDKAFGKPARLMRHRKEALDKLGCLSKENAKSEKYRVEWYLELEGLLQSIIDLGRKSDEMFLEAFSPTMLDKICSMFPSNLGCKLSRCDGSGENKLVNMMKKISEFRSDAQDWQLIREANPTAGATCNQLKAETTPSIAEERIGIGDSDSHDDSKEYEIANVLDSSWHQCEDYAEEMPDSSDTIFDEYEEEINDRMEQSESVMSLLYVVNNDLVGDVDL